MIYKGTTSLRFIVNTGANLTDASSVSLVYCRPRFGQSSFVATITDALNGVVQYDVESGDIDDYGIWTMYAEITFNDGSILRGSEEQFKVENNEC